MPKKQNNDIKNLIKETLGELLVAEWAASTDLSEEFGIEIPPHMLDPQTNPGLKITPLKLVLSQLVLKACKGQDKSIQEIMDRVLGKPAQYIEAKTEVTYLDFVDSLIAELPSQPHPVLSRDTRAEVPEIPVNFDAVKEEAELLDELDTM